MAKIQIQPKWENALEAVLRERLNSIEFDHLDSIRDWVDEAPLGKWAIFETMQPVLSDDQQLSITNHINCEKLLAYVTINQPGIEQVLSSWLNNVYIVEDVQEGLTKRSFLNSSDMLVTRQGISLRPIALPFMHLICNCTAFYPDNKSLLKYKKKLTGLHLYCN